MRAPQYGHNTKRLKAPIAPASALETVQAGYGRVRASQPRDKRRSRNDTRWHNWGFCGNVKASGVRHADLFSGFTK